MALLPLRAWTAGKAADANVPGMSREVEVALITGAFVAVVGLVAPALTLYLSRKSLRTEYMAEAAIRRLLQHPTWRRRSFQEISYHLPGFAADDLRRLLVRAGAVRMQSSNTNDSRELWGLLERNRDHVKDSFG